MENEFNEKIFIVTGAVKRHRQSNGTHSDRARSKSGIRCTAGQELASIISNLNPSHVEIIAADITDEQDRQRIINQTLKRFGGIDVLVNAAGIIGNGTIENTTLEQWDTMMDVNLRSIFG